MNHLMIDLETMGNRMDAAIVSIGAVFFEPSTGEIGPTFYRAIDMEDSFRFGRVDGSTVKWWMEQSDSARRAAIAGTMKLSSALTEFEAFFASNLSACVWGNGPTFDITIMEYAFLRCLDRSAPWKYNRIRDCRTIKDLSSGMIKIPDVAGTAHNALDDAIHQAKWVSDAWRALRKIQTPEATRVFTRDEIDVAVAAGKQAAKEDTSAYWDL